MARHKNPFCKNKELQEIILNERRVNYLTIQEIAEKYPQYSVVTYKRFLRTIFSIKESSVIEQKARNRRTKEHSLAQINSWAKRDQSKKDKQIEHLRNLASNQKDVKRELSESEIDRRKKHGKKIGLQDSNKARMREYSQKHIKYSPEDLLKIIENSGAVVIGTLPVLSGDTVIVQWPDGATRRCKIKQFIKNGFIPHPKVKLHEGEIIRFINNFGLVAIKKRFSRKEIDIYLEDKKIGIEHNGLFWHREKSKGKTYHIDKMNIINSYGIDLIQIWEHEWYHHKEQVKNFLQSRLGFNQKIYARNCDFVNLDISTASEFCTQNTFLPSNVNVRTAIGCFYENELVGIATFGDVSGYNSEIILDRFAFKAGVTVVGALSKFSKMGCEFYNSDIYLWHELRLGNGNSFLNTGWIEIERTEIDYFYWEKGFKVIQKIDGLNTNIKLNKVWDCGKVKFVFKNKKPTIKVG